MFHTNPAEIDVALSDEELFELDDLLAIPALEETSMDLSMLEGFLTAIVIGPRAVMPSAWLPWVWDFQHGRVSPEFADMDEADRVLSLVMRHYNWVVHQFLDSPDDFEPIYCVDERWSPIEWCDGFLLGTQFEEEHWVAMVGDHPEWMAPFVQLGTEEGLQDVEQDDSWAEWEAEIVPALAQIHAWWQSVGDVFPAAPGHQPVVRETPKVGRNDPCPCGSGKKFKKCCGATEPVLH